MTFEVKPEPCELGFAPATFQHGVPVRHSRSPAPFDRYANRGPVGNGTILIQAMPHVPAEARGTRSRTPVNRVGHRSRARTPVAPIEEPATARTRGRPRGSPAPRGGPPARGGNRRSPAPLTARRASPAPRQPTPPPVARGRRTPPPTARPKRRLAETSSDEDETPRPKARISNATILKKIEKIRKDLVKQHEANLKILDWAIAQLED
ncbi:hypothetical protein L596_008096 [Steinernema carpocapsae]|uniref:Uncharacterized protein n=1 Tax=Steinernema carpocapsae TaxID=34508 RepID=A0A4U5PBP3_STECR|nr:hypothetical protein L596_008096 [Steinernema carpocapsae]